MLAGAEAQYLDQEQKKGTRGNPANWYHTLENEKWDIIYGVCVVLV